MKLWMGLLVAALMVAGPKVQSVWADEGSGHMCEMMEHGESHEAESSGHYLHDLIKHAKDIGLTKDQIAQLKKNQLDFESARLRGEAEIHVADMEIAALADDEKAGMKAIEAKVKQRANMVAGLQVAGIKAKRDAMAVLTPEQREKEQTVGEKMMMQMQERKGGMGDGMMGKGGMGHGEGSKKEQGKEEHEEHEDH